MKRLKSNISILRVKNISNVFETISFENEDERENAIEYIKKIFEIDYNNTFLHAFSHDGNNLNDYITDILIKSKYYKTSLDF